MVLVYVLLILGAVTTLYPFLAMMSTGFKGPTDQNDNKLIPAFWTSNDELYTKYVADKYANKKSAIDATRTGGNASAATVQAYRRFLMGLPNEFWTAGFRSDTMQSTSKLNMLYQGWLRQRYRDIDALNKAYVEENVAFQTVTPPAELLERKNWSPLPGKKIEDWQLFKATLPEQYRLPVTERRMFQEFLRVKFSNQMKSVPPEIAAGATSFEAIPLPATGELFDEFKSKALPRRYEHQTVESLWAAVDSAPLPIEADERDYLNEHAGSVRAEFNERNYQYVLDYILLNGRALLNTAIFCLLAVLTQLIVNPLAAYALSRYPIPASGKILVFLLATMAFPAEVAMIPSFLLLKSLGLLNTFAALVLPTAASGYMIFLLKGFFDSLPQELYESGQIDGAKEATMLWKIALPLSRPVLGYLALLAFMGAYSSFMYAFLVAQDQRIWTLMVWIYQLQLTAPKAVIMAALTLAAIPTLVVFLLAQNVIMRGIVLPGER